MITQNPPTGDATDGRDDPSAAPPDAPSRRDFIAGAAAIGAAILLGRRLSLWMMARAIADSADVAIVIGVLVTGTPYVERALFGLVFAGTFCCLDIYLSQRLRYEERAAQEAATTRAARGVEVGRGGVRSAPE